MLTLAPSDHFAVNRKIDFSDQEAIEVIKARAANALGLPRGAHEVLSIVNNRAMHEVGAYDSNESFLAGLHFTVGGHNKVTADGRAKSSENNAVDLCLFTSHPDGHLRLLREAGHAETLCDDAIASNCFLSSTSELSVSYKSLPPFTRFVHVRLNSVDAFITGLAADATVLDLQERCTAQLGVPVKHQTLTVRIDRLAWVRSNTILVDADGGAARPLAELHAFRDAHSIFGPLQLLDTRTPQGG